MLFYLKCGPNLLIVGGKFQILKKLCSNIIFIKSFQIKFCNYEFLEFLNAEFGKECF